MRDDPGIEVIEHALVVDLLTDDDERVCGVTLHVIGEGQVDGVGAAHARAVVLATGGLGQIYSSTTNPPVATGDGMAAALRAGAVLADLEFVQFHPTVLWLGEGSRGQQPLISEAVRGEGAFLVDEAGERFMQGQHELADLAPRDVVSRAIITRMRETGTDHVYPRLSPPRRRLPRAALPLDRPAVPRARFRPGHELLPVAPAQHYASGGVRTDLRGRSSLEGLYACGETSCTGVHGANRLASNSLLEGLVFARRIADDLTARLAGGELPETTPVVPADEPELIRGRRRLDVQRAMTSGAGTVRSAASLAATQQTLHEVAALAGADDGAKQGGPKSWEATNLLHLGRALTYAAALRDETRGGHVREDFPGRDDTRYLQHVHLSRGEGGRLTAQVVPVPAANLEGLDLDGPAPEAAVAQDEARMGGQQ